MPSQVLTSNPRDWGVVAGVRKTCVCRLLPNAFACVTLAGCATSITVTPQLGEKPTPICQIHAAVQYDGKPDYLPAALIADPAAPGQLTFRYTYNAQYGLKETEPFLAAVNPLTLLGFPVGSDNVVVTGRVEVVRGDSTLRSYAAAAAMKRSSTVFSEGETFTEMRRRGLVLVRDNLSSQLCHDQALLAAMLGDSSSQSSKPDVHP